MWQTDTLTHSCEHDIRTYGRKNTDTQTHMEDIVRMNMTDRQVVTNRRLTDKYGKQSLEFSNTVGPVFTFSCEKSQMCRMKR